MTDAYVGEIRLFAGNYSPRLWGLCDGGTLPISDYQDLYAFIGTTYGGDGRINFNLPDFRGRLPVGQGTGPGLTPRLQGQSYGYETVAIDTQQMPTHTHVLNVSDDHATESVPSSSSTVAKGLHFVNSIDAGLSGNMASKVITENGEGLEHPNMMPSLAINFIICLKGIFPQKP
ncbi:MAG: tail fiber protein [Reinekea sp.]